MRSRWTVAAALLAAGFATACDAGVPYGTVEVLETLPHDPEAYTQGLLYHDGFLYESTGRYGESDVRRVDPATGEVLDLVPLSEDFFGEGLARVGGSLVQLTWKEGVAFVYDIGTLERRDTLELNTDGWGLCHDGAHLWSTSGGSILFRRDPATLEVLGSVQVTQDGTPLSRINELECVGDHVWANVFQSNDIVKIDKASGEVVLRFDGTPLVPPDFPNDPDAVLNGLALDPETGTYFVTGKLWPVLYRVRLREP